MRREIPALLVIATLATACLRNRGTTPITPNNGTATPLPNQAEFPFDTLGPEAILNRYSEFPTSAKLASASGNYEVSYSQMLLDYSGVKSIKSIDNTTLDATWNRILNNAYKLIGVPRGSRVKLAGSWQFQGNTADIDDPTDIAIIKGKVNIIKQYVVTAEEFDQIEQAFQFTNLPYIKNYELPDLKFTQSILYFNEKGELIIINWSDFRDAVNRDNASYFVIQSGPANAYVAIRESFLAGRNQPLYLSPPDPIYIDLGCNTQNNYCLKGATGSFEVTFK